MCLWDLDRQHSALEWLKLRPEHFPRIIRLDEHASAPRRADWLVLDSPARLHGKRLGELVKDANKVLVPIMPSVFDIAATRDFLAELAQEKVVRKHKTFVGVIGNRVDPRTRAATQLIAYVREHDMPLVGWLRERSSTPTRRSWACRFSTCPLAVGPRDAVLEADRRLGARGMTPVTPLANTVESRRKQRAFARHQPV